MINLKFAAAVENLEKQRVERETKEKEEQGFFTRLINGDKVVEPAKNTGNLRISKVLAQSIVFNCQSSFIHYFVGMKLSFEMSRELLLYFCKRYELDQSRTHLLLHDLEASQKQQINEITFADVLNISEERKRK